jgi:hypothetical protein
MGRRATVLKKTGNTPRSLLLFLKTPASMFAVPPEQRGPFGALFKPFKEKQEDDDV